MARDRKLTFWDLIDLDTNFNLPHQLVPNLATRGRGGVLVKNLKSKKRGGSRLLHFWFIKQKTSGILHSRSLTQFQSGQIESTREKAVFLIFDWVFTGFQPLAALYVQILYQTINLFCSPECQLSLDTSYVEF